MPTEMTLKPVYQNIRATAAGARSVAQLALLARAGKFAGTISQRYAQQQGYWPNLSLILGQPRLTTLLQPVHHHHRPHWAPRLALTVLARSPVVTGQPSGKSVFSRPLPDGMSRRARLTGPQPVWPAPVSTQRLLEVLVKRVRNRRRLELMPVEQIVHRLARRSERVEAGRKSRRLLAQLRSGNDQDDLITVVSPSVKPASRTVRRAATAPVSEDQMTAVQASSAVGRRHLVTMTEANRTSPDPIDLNRLTDQVVQAIDRRIIAHRERLGRI